MPLPVSPVGHARPPAISDRLLAQLRQLAHDAPRSLISEAEAEWLLSAAGPLLDELAARRAWMGQNAASADLANVITLPAAR